MVGFFISVENVEPPLSQLISSTLIGFSTELIQHIFSWLLRLSFWYFFPLTPEGLISVLVVSCLGHPSIRDMPNFPFWATFSLFTCLWTVKLNIQNCRDSQHPKAYRNASDLHQLSQLALGIITICVTMVFFFLFEFLIWVSAILGGSYTHYGQNKHK